MGSKYFLITEPLEIFMKPHMDLTFGCLQHYTKNSSYLAIFIIINNIVGGFDKLCYLCGSLSFLFHWMFYDCGTQLKLQAISTRLSITIHLSLFLPLIGL